ncbi:hypothetical protein [Gilvibacter sp.]|uniref:hypothetical protein n=1 Tax=Gilvibacter sp. TaxID=2729997 RepID=UPI0025BB5B50|nr:hypothetical protein [Gilvibacter sp.]NQX77515.1 hypothetical protein [Gilvibacter sp.]
MNYFNSGEFRSEIVSETEESTNSDGSATRYKNVYKQRYKLTCVVPIGQVAALSSLDRFDTKSIEIINARGDVIGTHEVLSLDIEDTGGQGDGNAQVFITWEDGPRSSAHVSDTRLPEIYTVGWDVTGDLVSDSTPSQPAQAPHQAFGNPFGTFTFTQIYQTLASTQSVFIRAWVVRPSGQELDFGRFTGNLGDQLTDASKWIGGTTIHQFFDPSDSIGNGNTLTFNKYQFAIANGFLSNETDERSITLRFDLSLVQSNTASVELGITHTVWGGFSSVRVSNPTTGASDIWLISNENTSNTLREVSSFRRPTSPSNSPVDATYRQFINVENTQDFSRYNIGVSTNGERFYFGALRTNGGYLSEWQRATFDNDNFCFTVRETTGIQHAPDVLSNPATYTFQFTWLFLKETTAGGFPDVGTTQAANPPKAFLDGTQIASYPSITPTTTFLSGVQQITLPDTEVHTITLVADTTGQYQIGTEFEVQLKPYF